MYFCDMDVLETIIAQMDGADMAGFVYFLQREKTDRRDLKLFDLMVKHADWTPEKITRRLYKADNRNAYHSLRKRLTVQLMDYVNLQRSMELKERRPSEVYWSMADYLLEKGDVSTARYFLTKAQRSALSLKDYSTLDKIHRSYIGNAAELGVDPEAAFELWRENRLAMEEHERLMLARSIVRKRLVAARQSGDTLDLDATVKEVFGHVQLNKRSANDPVFMLELCSVIRSAVISTKNYHLFEPFVRRIYNRLERFGAMNQVTRSVKWGFVYMICHVLYRNKKFDECEEQLTQLRQWSRRPEEWARSVLLEAAVKSYSGRNKEAADLLRKTLGDKRRRFGTDDVLNMQLNLAVYHFQSDEFKKANKVLMEMGHSDVWLEKKMGKEWRFKRSMIELIVQCELGNTEVALQRIRTLESYFHGFLKHPSYHRAGVFLKFIRVLITHPDRVSDASFEQEVERADMALPGDREDIQAITFFCWLKSKMVRRPYYEVLMDAMKRNDAQ